MRTKTGPIRHLVILTASAMFPADWLLNPQHLGWTLSCSLVALPLALFARPHRQSTPSAQMK